MQPKNENHRKGNELFKKKELVEAKNYYHLALKQLDEGDKDYGRVCSNLSLLYLKFSEYSKAYEFASQAISLQPTWAKGYFRLISLYERQGDQMEKIINIVIKVKITEDIDLDSEHEDWFNTFLSRRNIFFIRDVEGFQRCLCNTLANVRAHLILLEDIEIPSDQIDSTKVENIVRGKDVCLYGIYKTFTRITNIGLTLVQSTVLLKNIHIDNKNLNLSVLIVGGTVRLRSVTISAKHMGVKISGKYPSTVSVTTCTFRKCSKGISMGSEVGCRLTVKNCVFNNMRTCIYSNGIGQLSVAKCKMDMARNGIYVVGAGSGNGELKQEHWTKVKRCEMYDMVDFGVFASCARVNMRSCDLFSLRVGVWVDRGCNVEVSKTTFSKILRDGVVNSKDSFCSVRGCQFTQCNFSALHVLHSATRTFFSENEVFNNRNDFFYPVYIRYNRNGETEISNNQFYKNSHNTILYTQDSKKPRVTGQKFDIQRLHRKDPAIDVQLRKTKWNEYPPKYLENRCEYCLKLEVVGDNASSSSSSGNSSGNSSATSSVSSVSEKGEKLMLCSKCQSAHYCSKKCQVEGWKHHKLECGKFF